ncbi:hypothetical protein BsWGS_24156 [Bradybaena similaris]
MPEAGDISMTTTNITNSSSTVSEEERLEYIQQLQNQTTITMIPAMIFLIIVAIVGVIGNPLVLYVYARQFQQNPTRVFIMVIALLDLVANVVAIPGEIYDMFHIWDFDNPELCQARLFINCFVVISVAMALTAVAVVRYRKVCNPFGWQVTTTHAKRISVVVIFLGALFSAPYVITNGRQTKETPRPGIIAYECSEDDNYKNTIWPIVNNAFFLLLFIVSFLTLLILYLRIGVTAWRHRKLFKKFNLGSETASHSENRYVEMLGPACATTEPNVENVPHGPEHLQKVGTDADISSFGDYDYTRAIDNGYIHNHNEITKYLTIASQFSGRGSVECANDTNDGFTCHAQFHNQARTKDLPVVLDEFADQLNKMTECETENECLCDGQNLRTEKDEKFVNENCVDVCEVKPTKHWLRDDQRTKEYSMKLRVKCEFVHSCIRETNRRYNPVCHFEIQNDTIIKKFIYGKFVDAYNEVYDTDGNGDLGCCIAIPNDTNCQSFGTSEISDALKEISKTEIKDDYYQFQNEKCSLPPATSFHQVAERPNKYDFPCNSQSQNYGMYDTAKDVDALKAVAETQIQNDSSNNCQIQNEAKLKTSEIGECVDPLTKVFGIKITDDVSINALTLDQTNSMPRLACQSIDHLGEVSESKLKTDALYQSQIQRVIIPSSVPTCEFSENVNDATVIQIKDGLNVETESTLKQQPDNESVHTCQKKETGTYIVNRANRPKLKARLNPGGYHTRTTYVNRTTAIVITISAVYCIGFLPFIALSFFNFLAPDTYNGLNLTEASFYNLFYRLYFINSAANPIVYSLFGRKFRQECRKLFKCRSGGER